MAKDAKGHGSEKRGGGGSYPNIDNNLRGGGKHVGYSNGDVWHIQKSGNAYQGTHQGTGESIRGRTLGDVSGQLQKRSDEWIAGALGNGHPKSSPVATHPAMSKDDQQQSFDFRIGGKRT